jgi:Replication-relaxation
MEQTQTITRLSKYSRDPRYAQVSRIARLGITPTSLAIIEVIYRYRMIPTSLILKLVSGSRRNLYYHLQSLYQKHQLINRLALYRPGGYPEEFVYFLESNKPLELLVEHGIKNPDELDMSRYSHGSVELTEGHNLFVRHELMISRLHAMLELACRQSNDQVALADFRQGAELHSLVSIQDEVGEWEDIPVRPDAFFTLYFPQRPEGQQYQSFLYEADRKTMDTARMKKKLRGHFHFVVKQKRHRVRYNVPAIRAVLVETLDTHWADALRAAAADPMVSGPKPSNLFWFTASAFLTEPVAAFEGNKPKAVPHFLARPEVIFDPLWVSANDREGDQPRSILDP